MTDKNKFYYDPLDPDEYLDVSPEGLFSDSVKKYFVFSLISGFFLLLFPIKTLFYSPPSNFYGPNFPVAKISWVSENFLSTIPVRFTTSSSVKTPLSRVKESSFSRSSSEARDVSQKAGHKFELDTEHTNYLQKPEPIFNVSGAKFAGISDINIFTKKPFSNASPLRFPGVNVSVEADSVFKICEHLTKIQHLIRTAKVWKHITEFSEYPFSRGGDFFTQIAQNRLGTSKIDLEEAILRPNIINQDTSVIHLFNQKPGCVEPLRNRPMIPNVAILDENYIQLVKNILRNYYSGTDLEIGVANLTTLNRTTASARLLSFAMRKTCELNFSVLSHQHWKSVLDENQKLITHCSELQESFLQLSRNFNSPAYQISSSEAFNYELIMGIASHFGSLKDICYKTKENLLFLEPYAFNPRLNVPVTHLTGVLACPSVPSDATRQDRPVIYSRIWVSSPTNSTVTFAQVGQSFNVEERRLRRSTESTTIKYAKKHLNFEEMVLIWAFPYDFCSRDLLEICEGLFISDLVVNKECSVAGQLIKTRYPHVTNLWSTNQMKTSGFYIDNQICFAIEKLPIRKQKLLWNCNSAVNSLYRSHPQSSGEAELKVDQAVKIAQKEREIEIGKWVLGAWTRMNPVPRVD